MNLYLHFADMQVIALLQRQDKNNNNNNKNNNNKKQTNKQNKTKKQQKKRCILQVLDSCLCRVKNIKTLRMLGFVVKMVPGYVRSDIC